jgi:hypothetical protein
MPSPKHASMAKDLSIDERAKIFSTIAAPRS